MQNNQYEQNRIVIYPFRKKEITDRKHFLLLKKKMLDFCVEKEQRSDCYNLVSRRVYCLSQKLRTLYYTLIDPTGPAYK